MYHELTCNQVNALMSFYLEDKLNDKLKQYVTHHLNTCSKCRERYEKLKKLLEKNRETTKNNAIEEETKEQFITKQYMEFKKNLSAYIDNELNDDENIKIKKITISNPLARKDLEGIYSYKKLLYNAFEKTRNDFRDDYIKSVMDNITRQEHQSKKDPFLPIISALFATIIFLMLSLAWFTIESGILKFSFHF